MKIEAANSSETVNITRLHSITSQETYNFVTNWREDPGYHEQAVDFSCFLNSFCVVITFKISGTEKCLCVAVITVDSKWF
jgi:hypothetical protein